MAPHATNECYGNCSIHPLLRGWMVEAHVAMDIDGMSWGAYFFGEPCSADASAAKRGAEQMADLELESRSFVMHNHAQKMAVVSKMGVKKGGAARKIQRPCKWLYCNEAAPKSQWRDGRAPVTSNVVSECWAWEYTDPKTKVKKAPHTCPYLHPGEEGWCSQWLNNKNYDPMATMTQNRFCALKN